MPPLGAPEEDVPDRIGYLGSLREGAAGDANLMELLVEAVRARASLGEIVGTLRDIFGGYTEQPCV